MSCIFGIRPFFLGFIKHFFPGVIVRRFRRNPVPPSSHRGFFVFVPRGIFGFLTSHKKCCYITYGPGQETLNSGNTGAPCAYNDTIFTLSDTNLTDGSYLPVRIIFIRADDNKTVPAYGIFIFFFIVVFYHRHTRHTITLLVGRCQDYEKII